MDPVRNPYAPGAGQRPPELAGRDRELPTSRSLSSGSRRRPSRALDGAVRTARCRQDGAAQRAARAGRQASLGDRQARGAARPLAAAAVRPGRARRASARWPTGTATRTGSTPSPACSSPSRCAPPSTDRKGVRWQPPTDVPAARGRADSGDLELDLIELFTDVAELARDLGVGVAIFVDEMQDISTAELAALCGACHEISQQGAPLVVVGAGLPHLPVALAASKSYAERLFRYVVVDRLPREMAARALLVPAGTEDVDFDPGRARRAVRADRRLPVLRAGLRQGHLGRRPGPARSGSPTYARRRRRLRRSSPWASSVRATNGRPPPSATTCGRWPTSRRSATTER